MSYAPACGIARRHWRFSTLTITIKDIEAAREVIKGAVLRTPMLPAPRLSALTGADVYVKYENLQVTNSFKERGALVKLTTASGRVLYNHVSLSVGFMSSSDKRLHFGLGGDSAARSLEIRWPSGKTQTLENVKADQVLRVEEPA